MDREKRYTSQEVNRLLRRIRIPKEQQQALQLDLDYQPSVIVIAGPTATGKTSLSIDLAKMLGGEIISADSMQVYRMMDIGTAKASIDEQVEVVHHLIDVADVSDPMNVATYYEEATKAIRSVAARDKVPIVVGGSGFYLNALLYGPPKGPSADPFVRAHLESEMERLGPEWMYEELMKRDPEYGKTITYADRHKIIRALEIIILTESKVSDLEWKDRQLSEDFKFKPFFLYRPREILYERIDQRCDEMIQQGFLEEVSHLIDHGLLENPSAMRAIGYRQALDYLKSARSEEDLVYFCHEFKKASRRYAKRQFTWFRKEKHFRWINVELHDPELTLDAIVQEYFLP